MQSAWGQDAIILGYDIHGKPWLWPDRIRVMQAILLGMTGAGKSTLLKNIIIQDLYRTVGQPDVERVPIRGRVDGHCLDVALVQRADDAHRDLSPVGDENAPEHA